MTWRGGRHTTVRAVVLQGVVPGAFACVLLAGCHGSRSTLNPAGVGAERIAELAWWLFGGAALIWVAVMGLALYATRISRPPHPVEAARLLILGGGVVFPTLLLAVLLGYGLWLMPQLTAPAPVATGALSIQVSGEQWWWRVRYPTPDGGTVELANELWLPVGERVELRLSSPDVIHSLWVPALAGKMDMIPGRETRLVIEPTRTGEFPGVCAEYCGTAHAKMAFVAVVSERADFDRWLTAQRAPARAPATALAERGERVFTANGCGACHGVRGTAANGVVGPDLTHVGSRRTLGAGVLRNGPEALKRWVGHPRVIKPGVNMPAFGMLPEDDLAALAAYLEGLQ